MTFCDLINFGTHFCRGEKGVLPPIHRGATGMGGLAVEGDRVPFHAEGSEDGAQGQIEVEQHRPLLDVEFEIGGGGFEFVGGIFDVVESDADLL